MNLDLLKYKDLLELRTQQGLREVLDPVRRRFVPLTPEEFVRQLLIQYLMVGQGIARGRIAVERKIVAGKLEKRFDLLVFDAAGNPWMLIECKSAAVSLSQEVMEQAGWYNTAVRAPFLIITNGMTTLGYKIDFDTQQVFRLFQFPEK
jgi:hypothetical protein